MAKVFNATKKKSNDLYFATEQECEDRRKFLIESGVITPAKRNDVIFRKKFDPVINTIESSRIIRRKLIDKGIISPELCQVKSIFVRGNSSDQGEYKTHPIKTEEEYNRRKNIYFRMMQEILYSRWDLRLVLVPKKESDPDWYF